MDSSAKLKVGLLSGGATTRVIRALQHPRYVHGAPESPYDFALISFDATRLFGARSIAAATADLQTGKSVWLPEKTNIGHGFRHVSLKRNDIRPLRIRLDDASGIWCRGDSGAPLLSFGKTGLVVIGVMSGGEATCNGNAYAARLIADVGERLDSPRRGRAPWERAGQTCSECLDENSNGAGRCLTAAQLCATSPGCAALEQDLFIAAPNMDRPLLGRLKSNEAGVPWWRCICVATCSDACNAPCALEANAQ